MCTGGRNKTSIAHYLCWRIYALPTHTHTVVGVDNCCSINYTTLKKAKKQHRKERKRQKSNNVKRDVPFFGWDALLLILSRAATPHGAKQFNERPIFWVGEGGTNWVADAKIAHL